MHLCYFPTQAECSVHVIHAPSQDRNDAHRHYIESEVLNHSALNHPHVVSFREVFLSSKTINL